MTYGYLSCYVSESGIFTDSSSFKLVTTIQAYDFIFGDPRMASLSNADAVVLVILRKGISDGRTLLFDLGAVNSTSATATIMHGLGGESVRDDPLDLSSATSVTVTTASRERLGVVAWAIFDWSTYSRVHESVLYDAPCLL